MTYHVLAKGKFTVAALFSVTEDFSTTSPSLTFLHEMCQNKNTSSSCKGFWAVFARLAELGPPLTSALMHEVNKENAIQELIKGDLRLLCFIEKDTIYLTNGYVKKSQKANPAEVTKAIAAKKLYLRR